MARKKTYYLPGLISLVGLPFIFLFFIAPDKPEPVQLRFFLPNDRHDEEGFISFSKYSVWKEARKKRQLTVEFWQNDTTELSEFRKAAKFDYIRRQIERLSFAHDTNVVLKIELSDASSYADFVHLVNLMLIYDVKRYALTDYTFYVFANEAPGNAYRALNVKGPANPHRAAAVEKGPLNPNQSAPEEDSRLIHYSSEGARREELISLANLRNRKIVLLSGFIILILIPGFYRVKKYYFKGMPGLRDNVEI